MPPTPSTWRYSDGPSPRPLRNGCVPSTAHRFDGYAEHEIDVLVGVERSLQLKAVGCHPSQAVAGSVLWHRIQLLEDKDQLHWLRRERVANM